jgi:hypothetical protein
MGTLFLHTTSPKITPQHDPCTKQLVCQNGVPEIPNAFVISLIIDP